MPPDPATEHTEATREALLAGAATNAAHLVEISTALLKELKLSKVARTYFVVMTALILLICSGLTWIALSNRATNHSVKENTARIIDCTSSGGKCYEQGQKQTAQAVAAIVNAQLAASWCSRHVKTFSNAQKCVIRLTRPS